MGSFCGKAPKSSPKAEYESHQSREISRFNSLQILPNIQIEFQSDIWVLFILGGPGAGKTTQCNHLKANPDWHLVPVSFSQSEAANPSSDRPMRNSTHIDRRASSEAVILSIRSAILRNATGRFFVIEGFPRNIENIVIWEREMTHVKVLGLFYLECRGSVLKDRLARRSKFQQRSDDQPDIVGKKIEAFQRETEEMLKEWKRHFGRYKTINGNEAISEVQKEIAQEIQRLRKEKNADKG